MEQKILRNVIKRWIMYIHQVVIIKNYVINKTLKAEKMRYTLYPRENIEKATYKNIWYGCILWLILV